MLIAKMASVYVVVCARLLRVRLALQLVCVTVLGLIDNFYVFALICP